MNVKSVIYVIKRKFNVKTIVKAQNSKMYYITFTGQYKYFKGGFLQG